MRKRRGSKDVVERTARVFLGMQIRCAECHDHPFDDWTQQDFMGMAAFFWQARSEVRGGGGTESQIGMIVDDATRGEPGFAAAEKAVKKPEEPKAGKTPGPAKQSVGPRYKSTGEGVGENESRRAAFRAAAHRRPPVRARRRQPPLGPAARPGTAPSAGRLFGGPETVPSRAARGTLDEFIRTGYDVRKLLKSILLSKPYQLSSRRPGAEESAARLFTQAPVAPLLPEQLFESVVRATGFDESKPNPKGREAPEATRSAKHSSGNSRRRLRRTNRPSGDGSHDLAGALLPETGSWSPGHVLRGGVPPGPAAGAREGRSEAPGGALPHDAVAAAEGARDRGAPGARPQAGDSSRIYEDIFWALLNSTNS
jgi:hypothetical protein